MLKRKGFCPRTQLEWTRLICWSGRWFCLSHLLTPPSEGWGMYCFHRYVSVHTWGIPHLHPIIFPLVPCLFLGDTPVTHPRSLPRGVPQSQARINPSPRWAYPKTEVPFQPGQDCGIHPPHDKAPPPPQPGQDRYPPLDWDRTEQQDKYLLRGLRYASCVHAGGLFCLQMYFENEKNKRPSNECLIWIRGQGLKPVFPRPWLFCEGNVFEFVGMRQKQWVFFTSEEKECFHQCS